MKTEITVQIRAFPVLIQDQRTGAESYDTIVLDKERLQAAQIVGQSSKELIYRMYNRKGFHVLDIGKPVKKEVLIDLESLFLKGGDTD